MKLKDFKSSNIYKQFIELYPEKKQTSQLNVNDKNTNKQPQLNYMNFKSCSVGTQLKHHFQFVS